MVDGHFIYAIFTFNVFTGLITDAHHGRVRITEVARLIEAVSAILYD